MNDTLIFVSEELPARVKGFCFENKDCDNIIVVNSVYCPETQRRVVCHELRHIISNHLNRTEDTLEDLEANAG